MLSSWRGRCPSSEFRLQTPLLLLSPASTVSQDCLGSGVQKNVKKNTNLRNFLWALGEPFPDPPATMTGLGPGVPCLPRVPTGKFLLSGLENKYQRWEMVSSSPVWWYSLIFSSLPANIYSLELSSSCFMHSVQVLYLHSVGKRR